MGPLVILVLCIFICCSLFCDFLDFLHFREFLVLVVFWIYPFSRKSRSAWFLFCLPLHHRFAGQPSTFLNPPTSDFFLLPPHITAHLPRNHTPPPHHHTRPPFSQDLTPDPVVDKGGVAHALTSNTLQTDKNAHGCHGEGGGERPHTLG